MRLFGSNRQNIAAGAASSCPTAKLAPSVSPFLSGLEIAKRLLGTRSRTWLSMSATGPSSHFIFSAMLSRGRLPISIHNCASCFSSPSQSANASMHGVGSPLRLFPSHSFGPRCFLSQYIHLFVQSFNLIEFRSVAAGHALSQAIHSKYHGWSADGSLSLFLWP